MSSRDLKQRTLKAARVAIAVAVSGCAGNAQQLRTPEDSLRAFARALSDAKPEDAYALLASDYRAHVTLEAWQKQLEDNADEASELGNTLAQAKGPAQVQAMLHDRDGHEVRLIYENERWSIAPELVEFYDQSTPRAALRAFVRAMQRKRYEVVLRLMPNADKEGVTSESMAKAWGHDSGDEVERMLVQLRDHLDDPIEVTGNHATMPYADRARVQFLREDGRWKIEDPE